MSNQSDAAAAAAAAALIEVNDFIWVGNNFESILYGLFLSSTLVNIHYLWKRRNNSKLLLTYSIITLITTTVYYGNGTNQNQLQVIDSTSSSNVQTGFQGSFSFLNALLADGVLIYRCYVIWNHNKIVLLLSIVGWIGQLGTDIAALILFLSNGNYSDKDVQNVLLSTFSIGFGLNVILPLMIAGRLLVFRKQLRSVIGAAHTEQYTSIATIVVESAASYGAVSFMTIITYGIGHPSFQFFNQFIYMMPTLAASWIIYRCANGTAVSTTDTTKFVSGTIVFTPGKSAVGIKGDTTTRVGSDPGVIANQSHSSFEKADQVV